MQVGALMSLDATCDKHLHPKRDSVQQGAGQIQHYCEQLLTAVHDLQLLLVADIVATVLLEFLHLPHLPNFQVRSQGTLVG
jgi:hypothetical protein